MFQKDIFCFKENYCIKRHTRRRAEKFVLRWLWVNHGVGIIKSHLRRFTRNQPPAPAHKQEQLRVVLPRRKYNTIQQRVWKWAQKLMHYCPLFILLVSTSWHRAAERCVLKLKLKLKLPNPISFFLSLSLLVCERRLSILFLVTTYNTSVLESNVAWSMDKFEPFRRLLNVNLYCISYVACNCQILSLVLVLPKSERLNCIGKPIPGAQCS